MTASPELSRADEVRAEATPEAAAPSRPGRVPDFFIVGHHKSGTTALYEMLRRRPDVFMPEMKEPWFFAKDLPLRFGQETPLPQTLEEYLALFAAAGADQRVGEATPSYLMSRAAAAGIAEVQPQARIV